MMAENPLRVTSFFCCCCLFVGLGLLCLEANGSIMEVTHRDAAVEERCGVDVEGIE